MEKIAGDKDWREPDAGLLLNIFDLYYDLASAPAQYAAKRAHILEAAKKRQHGISVMLRPSIKIMLWLSVRARVRII